MVRIRIFVKKKKLPSLFIKTMRLTQNHKNTVCDPWPPKACCPYTFGHTVHYPHLSIFLPLLSLPPTIVLSFFLLSPPRTIITYCLSPALSLSVSAHSPELCFLVKVTVSLHLLWLSKSITRAAPMCSSTQCSHQVSRATASVQHGSVSGLCSCVVIWASIFFFPFFSRSIKVSELWSVTVDVVFCQKKKH